MDETEVLIVGAGPTGLTLACDLARRGVAFRIVDAQAHAPCGSRGKGLQPRTLEVFDDLGCVDEILAAGMRYPRLRPHFGPFALGSWAMQKPAPASPGVPYRETWLVPQDRTETVLTAHLARAGGRVERGVACTHFEQDPTGVTATLLDDGHETTVRARYLVGADGGRSRVRRTLGLAFEGRAFEGERIVVGDLQVDGLDRTDWHVWPRARGGGMVALCPMPDGVTFQLFAKLPRDATMPALTHEGLRDFVAHATRGLHVRQTAWCSLYRPQARRVDRYRVGRVFVAGDAAHVHPPDGGQGLNTGVQDAYNLGWKLARVLAGALDPLLDTYETERLPIAADVLGLSSRLHRSGSTKRGERTQQLGLGYRNGPLALDARVRPGTLRAGDRAPDAACTDDAGRRVRLFDAFRGTRAVLLAFGRGATETVDDFNARYGERLKALCIAPATSTAHRHTRVDAWNEIRRGYEPSDDARVLIRPDGYIAAITERASDLDAMLARM